SDLEHAQAGGKGSALARLYQAKYPVPDGFVILPDAFVGNELTAESWSQIKAQLASMRKVNDQAAFAVRSSATCEDSASTSFAGEFETVLDVHTDEMIKEAILRVRSSRDSERVRAYSKAKGIDTEHEMAVVIQHLVRADISGILFTCDPVTGSHDTMTGNYVHGFGEELVSGEVEPYTFTLSRPKGIYDGPVEFKPHTKKLFKLGRKLIGEFGTQQDIEWAIKDGKLFLLQSRPITTLIAHDPATGAWNDSNTGNFLWSSNNFGEGRPDVMTPYTWSLTNYFWKDMSLVPGYSYAGNIGGRLYANISVMASMLCAFGKDLDSALREIESGLGKAPEGVEVPLIPIPKSMLLSILPNLMKIAIKQQKGRKRSSVFLSENPKWCKAMESKLRQANSGDDLRDFWRLDLEPYILETLEVFFGSTEPYENAMKLRRELVNLVGEENANALFLNFSDTEDFIASLGPLVGIAKVANGEMSREEYLEKFGHRGPHEAEYSIPRPIEDPSWLDRQLEEYRKSPVNVKALLAKQEKAFEEAWERFEQQYPKKAKKVRRKLELVPDAARLREAVRSEAMRMGGIQRAFALRVGEITGLGDDVFFLSISEILEVLSGDDSAIATIPSRKETHQKFSELPPYPMIIRGRFDPLQWAADPQRRSDFYDASGTITSPVSKTITGFAGAAGQVEAPVRVLETPEQSVEFQEGEILVAVSTNVGWTPLFLRAAAVVTDVGAPLSHAAIVARELGIPAVVGCGNATMRLRTGDRARVNGGAGIVEILDTMAQDRSK
ncbi:MAG: PEP/pyruvate-binding domain-containing protein, partial [Anaerolineales bacterium]